MEYITNTFRYVLGFSNKKEVTGYIISQEVNRTLLMVQESEKYWASKWYDHQEYTIHPLEGSMNPIFTNSTS
jgi:hypothetical protein